jgi:hypothetical protein
MPAPEGDKVPEESPQSAPSSTRRPTARAVQPTDAQELECFLVSLRAYLLTPPPASETPEQRAQRFANRIMALVFTIENRMAALGLPFTPTKFA